MQTDAELLAADVAARRDALDVSRSFIVQAPAGSGKTELLIQRYLKLLTVVEQPEEILAITFTRKAALEMRLRVVTALQLAATGTRPAAEHEALTYQIAAAVLDRDTKLNWALLRSPGRMRIETVDAFSASIARSLPISSGLGGASATVADSSMREIYQSAAAATLDWLLAEDDNAASVAKILTHLDGNTNLYVSYLSNMLATREQWLGIVGGGQGEVNANAARQQLESNIAHVVEAQLRKLDALMPRDQQSELLQLLRYAGTNLQEEHSEHGLAEFANQSALPRVTADDRTKWQAVADLLLIKSGAWRKSVTKKDGFPAGDKDQKQKLYDLIEVFSRNERLQQLLHSVRDLPEPRYTDEQWDVLLALFGLLPLAVAELRRVFGERGVTDHSEVALAARQAMGSDDQPGDIALALDYKIQHLLVDEMQDTSIGQYDLLRATMAGWSPEDGRTVFCVGDPMQSIYRFRDAEVGEFLLTRRVGIGALRPESLVLRQNFRSGENLVHWFNTVFSQILPLQDDVSLGAISYADSVPVAANLGQGDYSVHPLFDADPSSEARRSAEVIQRCLATYPDDNMAVLVRSRTQLPQLLHELRERKISYQAVEIDRLTDLPEVIDVIALSRALSHDFDRLAWLAVLRGPCVGLTWSDIHSLVRNDLNSTVPDLMRDEDRISTLSKDGERRTREFRQLIDPYCQRHAASGLRDRVELAWFHLGGPALLDSEAQVENIYRFFRVLDRIEVAGTLEDVAELERLLDDERVSSAPGDDCRLQIMTMHKAKGLQFDHVLLHSLGRMSRGSESDVLNWLFLPDENGGNELIISPVGSRSMLERDLLHQFIARTESNKDALELDRLLYVACTRAKKSLHLVGSVSTSNDGEEFKPPHARSLLRRLWPAVEGVFASAFEHRSAVAESAAFEMQRLRKPDLKRLRDDWQPPRLPPLAKEVPGRGDTNADHRIEISYDWVRPLARHVGTLVHRWMQRITDQELSLDSEDLAWTRPTTRRWARGLGVAEADMDQICNRVETAVRGSLEDEKGRWLLYGPGASELPITGIYEGDVTSIVIDRVRIDDAGLHWIVDYKTSTREGGDIPGFLGQEIERHRPQLRKYATLYSALNGCEVRTALYLPLLQEFCVVDVVDST